jgi:hypothetical protein
MAPCLPLDGPSCEVDAALHCHDTYQTACTALLPTGPWHCEGDATGTADSRSIGFTAAFALAALQTMLPLAMPPGMAGASSRAGLPLALGMAALAAGEGQMLLQRLEDRFVFVDCRHSDK